MSSSNSPCAACKFLRRKCTQECVFAPYFPPDQPQKFANVHKVFGASNVAKILNELNAAQREDAVNSLAYEAEARLRDPVYGCVGLISILQHRLKQVQTDLHSAKQELASYLGPAAMMPLLNPGYMQQFPNMQPQMGPVMQANMQPMLGLQQQHQQQLYEAQQQQLAVDAAREQQQQHELLRNFEQQQQQHHHQQHQQQSAELLRFNGGYDSTATASGQVNPSGFGPMSPALALGGGYDNNVYQIQQAQPQQEQQHHQLQLLPQQLLLQQAQPPQPHSGDGGDDGRTVGPSC